MEVAPPGVGRPIVPSGREVDFHSDNLDKGDNYVGTGGRPVWFKKLCARISYEGYARITRATPILSLVVELTRTPNIRRVSSHTQRQRTRSVIGGIVSAERRNVAGRCQAKTIGLGSRTRRSMSDHISTTPPRMSVDTVVHQGTMLCDRCFG